MGQMQLRHRKNTIAEEQETRIWKSHGLKHLCVFTSLLEFQPSPIFLLANTIGIWDKFNCATGQIQLQKNKKAAFGKVTILSIYACFRAFLEFQPSPIFLPIELSYCIIAMHWNGSFPPTVSPLIHFHH